MPERVAVWQPQKRLEFDVLKTPPAMVKSNPFGYEHAQHLEGYFQAKRGRFILTPLPNGRTRVEGPAWKARAGLRMICGCNSIGNL